MPEFVEIFQLLPEKTREILNPLWDHLPEQEMEALKEKIEVLPVDFNLVNMLLDLTKLQMKIALGRKNRMVIVGFANVGKSTIYNRFIREKTSFYHNPCSCDHFIGLPFSRI